MKSPRVWDDDEDVVLLQRGRVKHQIVTEEASNLAGAGDVSFFLEESILFFYHPFAESGPGLGVDGKNEKDLEWMEAFTRRVGGGAGGDEAGELNKAAALSLRIVQR